MVLGLRRARFLIAGLAVAAVALVVPLAAAAFAQDDGPGNGPMVFSSCTGTDHSGRPPADPVMGNVVNSPSVWMIAMWLTGVVPEAIVEIHADGASGPVTGYGVVAPGGYVIVEIPAYSYGPHEVTSLTVDGVDVATDIAHTIDGGEPACDETLIAAPPPSTTSSSTTTTTTTASTTTTSTTTTSTTTTTPTTTAPVREVSITKEQDKSSPELWMGVVVASGLITTAGAGLVVNSRGGKGPCDELRAAWLSAQAACDQARAKAAEAAQAAADAEQRQQDLEAELGDLQSQWPSLGDGDPKGSIELPGVPGSRITSHDLALRRRFAGQAWDDYIADPNPESAQQLETEWEKLNTPEFQAELKAQEAAAEAQAAQLEAQIAEAAAAATTARAEADAAHAAADKACADAAAARRALDECEGAASGDPASSGGDGEPDPEPDDGDDPPGESPEQPSAPSAPPPSAGDPCDGMEKTKLVDLATFDETVYLDFSIFVSVDNDRNVTEAEELAVTFSEISDHLNKIGKLLGAAGNISTAAAGSYVQAGVDAATGAAKDAAGIPTIPTSPASIVTTILEKTSDLTALVAKKAGQWLKNHETYTVRVVYFVRPVTMVAREHLACVGGAWDCVEHTLDTALGDVDKRDGKTDTPVFRKELKSVIRSKTRYAANLIATDAKAMAEFRDQHPPGPC